MFKFYIKVFGCPMRGIEAERVKNYFIANNGKPVKHKHADVVVIFGCSIVESTNDITMDYIKKSDSKDQRIIISGCSPVMSENQIREFFDGELLGSKYLDRIDELFPDFKVKFNEISLPTKSHKNLEYNHFYLKQFTKYQKIDPLKFNLKPQLIITSKGCPNACSYCAVRKAFGGLKSFSTDEIINNYKQKLKERQQVFVFNGDDTGAFGLDTDSGFDELLNKMEKVTPENRHVKWALDNLHPRWLIKYQDTILKLIKKGRIIDMVVPFQAASDRLLKLMRRNYTIDELLDVIKKVKKINPDLKLTNHFMFGFPGENDKDIMAIKEIVDLDLYQHFVLLRYFESPLAASYKMEPKVPLEITQKNMHYIHKYILDKGYICQMTDYEQESLVD